MAELYASMARRTITATLSGLSEEHKNGRTFHWYLDGTLVETQQTKEHLSTQEYTFTAVPYQAEHTVEVQVNDYSDEEEFGRFSADVADTMSLWTWNGSNGVATAAQTQAAYIAATTQGQTADFSRHVWNDLVEKLASAVPAWKTGYSSIDETLMAAKYDNLTADRFNAVVQNIGNPWMYWACKPGRKGYLGRLAVKGYKQSGAAADTVYGAYLIELAHMLNVLIDAEGEFDAGYAKRLGHINLSGLYTSASLPLRAPPSRHLEVSEWLYQRARSLGLTAPPSRHLERTGSLWTVPDIAFRADEAKHLAIRNRIRIFPDLTLVASNERAMNADHLISTITDILLNTPESRALVFTARPKTRSDATLDQSQSVPISVVLRFIANEDITLTASSSTDLSAVIPVLSGLLAELSPSASSILGITAGSVSVPNILLVPAETAQLLYTDAVSISDSLVFSAPTGKHMVHQSKVDFLWQFAELTASVGAKMAHAVNAGVDLLSILSLTTATSAKMEHREAQTITALLAAMLSAPDSAHMAHKGWLSLSALFFAHMNAPQSVRMEFTAKAKIALAGTHALSVPPSVWLAAASSSRVRDIGEFDLSAAPSVHMDATIVEALQGDGRSDLSAQPSTKLSGVTKNNTSRTNSTLTPLPSQQMAHIGTLAQIVETAELIAQDSIHHALDGAYITAFSAALLLEAGTGPGWVTQTGTNLYIQGIWSSWADGEHLQIDTAEFYEPVRVGSNLYIRSVNKSWVDGSSANIDTEFFLDPIQTGSNLYIRQDVLGG